MVDALLSPAVELFNLHDVLMRLVCYCCYSWATVSGCQKICWRTFIHRMAYHTWNRHKNSTFFIGFYRTHKYPVNGDCGKEDYIERWTYQVFMRINEIVLLPSIWGWWSKRWFRAGDEEKGVIEFFHLEKIHNFQLEKNLWTHLKESMWANLTECLFLRVGQWRIPYRAPLCPGWVMAIWYSQTYLPKPHNTGPCQAQKVCIFLFPVITHSSLTQR